MQVLGTAVAILSNFETIVKHYCILLLKAFFFNLYFDHNGLDKMFGVYCYCLVHYLEKSLWNYLRNPIKLPSYLHVCQSSKLNSLEGKHFLLRNFLFFFFKATSWWTQIHKETDLKVFIISAFYYSLFASLQKLCLMHPWTIRIPMMQLTQSIQWFCCFSSFSEEKIFFY